MKNEETPQKNLGRAQEVLDSIPIPSQPKIIMEISREINKPEPVLSKISALVSEDVAMSAKVIKLVNSIMVWKIRTK